MRDVKMIRTTTIDYSNLAGELLAGSEEAHKSFLSTIYLALGAPEDGAQALEVLQAVSISLKGVSQYLMAPTDDVFKLQSAANGCLDLLRIKMGNTLVSACSSLDRKKSIYPVWVAYASLGKAAEPHRGAIVLAGCAILLAICGKEGRIPAGDKSAIVSKSIAADLNILLKLPQITDEQLSCLLWHDIAEDFQTQEWPMRLRKRWRDVLRLCSNSESPPPSNPERIRAQILGTTLNCGAAHRAGATNHRSLSDRQFQNFLNFLRLEIATDNLGGTLGLLVIRTGLSVDVAADLQLDSANRSTKPSTGFMDVELGIVELDLRIAVHQAAQPLPGSRPSDFTLQIRFPADLQKKLAIRKKMHPAARRLSDLYPGAVVPNTSDPVYGRNDEIEATWSRLRNTLGPYLRNNRFNTLHAALLSGDLGLIPRSKLHYASVPARELYLQECNLYLLLGLGDPVALPPSSQGTGCRTVPAVSNLVEHDRALSSSVDALRPGKHGGLSRLYAFHNQFTLLCAWRLSVLLALRAAHAIDLDASIDEDADTWIAIHDKHTPEDQGFQPVPLCSYAAEVIRLYKRHCAAMHKRLQSQSNGSPEFSMSCKSIAGSHRQRLLYCVSDDGSLQSVSSGTFISAESSTYQLPADVGRKVMENMLREEGIKSSFVDAVLRHFTTGQIRSSGFNTESLNSFVAQTRRAQDRIASTLFGAHVIGLSQR